MKRALYILSFIVCGSVNAQQGLHKYDINTGGNSYPQYLTAVGYNICFFAIDSSRGIEPRMADSTGAVYFIGDVNSKPQEGSIVPNAYKRPACGVDGKFYFSGDNGFAGAELFVWNGGKVAPILAADIQDGSGGSYPESFVVQGMDIFFKAGTSARGNELWKYNVTTGYVDSLADVAPGKDSGVLGNLTLFNSEIFFTGKTAATGVELYVYNPILDTITLGADINPGIYGSNPQDLIVYNGKLYFSADDGVHGRELFVYSGLGTARRLSDIVKGLDNSVANYGVPHMIGFKNKLWFSAHAGNNQYHLYSYNPSNDKVTMEVQTNYNGSSDPRWPGIHEGKMFFCGYDASHGFELWSYDGTTPPELAIDMCEGTKNGNVSELTVIGPNLYFRANDCDSIGDELFRYNTTTVSVKKLMFQADIKVYPNPASESANLELVLHQPETLSITLKDISGKLLWKSNAALYGASKHTVNIPMQFLSSGNYYYTIYSGDENHYLASGKIVKQ